MRLTRVRLLVPVLAAIPAGLWGCGSGSGGSAGAPSGASDASTPGDDSAMQDDVSIPAESGAPSDAARPGDASGLDAGAPAIRIIGRVDEASDAGPRFAWSGSTVVARFTGPTIGVHLADTSNDYGVFVDGTEQAMPLVTSAATHDYPLASNLGAGPHELRLYRLTEANQGDTQLLGLMLDPAGALLPPPAPAARRIEIVGDSISCGYGDTGMGPSCSFSPGTENHYLSYGALTARNLGADLVTVAWSGKGMFRNYGGDTTETMPVLYLRTLPDQTTSVWDFARYTPDVVVINLGTNDFAKGDPGQPYVDAYTSFVHVVRTKYPAAYIECTLGPMLGDPSLTTARGYVQGVVSALKAAGDTHVGYLEYPTQSASNGLGCDYHPSVTTHQLMATQLTGALKTALGW